jgi:hypothetical protein
LDLSRCISESPETARMMTQIQPRRVFDALLTTLQRVAKVRV